MRFPVNRHRVWQLVFDAVLIVAAWRLTFFLRFDKTTPIFYRHLLDWQVVTLVVAIFILFASFLQDIVVALLDPRVRVN